MRLRPAIDFSRQAVLESTKVSFTLFKVMIPVIIGVKIIKELGLIPYLARPLSPVMGLVGLPPEMGLVWATAMVNNLYSAMAVFVNVQGDQSLTTAQVTILTTMMLVAHALPVELRIAQRSGPRILFQAAARVGGAFILGMILHGVYSAGGWLQHSPKILWNPGQEAQTIPVWLVDQALGLLMIWLIILLLIISMKVLTRLKVIDALIIGLRPLLKIIGVGREAATITIIGMSMGLSYGGGLIIKEADSGKAGHKDIFFALTLMGLSHSIIEDTLLMMVLGGSLSGLLWGRVVFSLLVVALLVRLVRGLPEKTFYRYFFRKHSQG